MELNNLTLELMNVISMSESLAYFPQATEDRREHEYIADLTNLNARVPGGFTADYTLFRIVLKLFGSVEKTVNKKSNLYIKYIAFFDSEQAAQRFDPQKEKGHSAYLNADLLFNDPRIKFTDDITASLTSKNDQKYLKLSIKPGTYFNNDLRLIIEGHKLDFNLVSEYKYIKLVYFADYNKQMTITINKYASPSVTETETWFPVKSSTAKKQCFTALSFRTESENSVIKYKGKSINIKPHDICLIPQNIEYQHSASKDSFIVFHFNALKGIDEEIRVFTLEDPSKYLKLFKKAYSLWKSKATGYRYRTTALLYEILSELEADNALIDSNIDSDISKSLNIIEKNFQRSDFRIEQIAKELFLSEVHLRQKFKKQLGISPKKYLIKRRIQEAEIMLRAKYYSQLEISQKCGFSDVKYFRFAFKEETGMTVSEYKSTI